MELTIQLGGGLPLLMRQTPLKGVTLPSGDRAFWSVGVADFSSVSFTHPFRVKHFWLE